MAKSTFTHRKDCFNSIEYNPNKPEPNVYVVCGDFRSGGDYNFESEKVMRKTHASDVIRKEFGENALLKLREFIGEHFTKNSYPLVFNSDSVTLRYEDRGKACIAELEDPSFTDLRPDSNESSDDGYGLFIRFQSWDGKREHPLHKTIAGKKLKITIEILE